MSELDFDYSKATRKELFELADEAALKASNWARVLTTVLEHLSPEDLHQSRESDGLIQIEISYLKNILDELPEEVSMLEQQLDTILAGAGEGEGDDDVSNW